MNIKYKKLNILFICSFVLFFYACGGGGSEGSGEEPQGDIHFNLMLSDNEETSGSFVQLDTEPFNCEENQISTIEVVVFNPFDEEIAFGGPWDCEARRGIISDVEAGSNLRIDVFALDDTDTVVFKGSKDGLTVIAGQTTDAGIITLFRVANRNPELSVLDEHRIKETETLTFQVSATDPDIGQTLTYSAENLPQGAQFNSVTQTFSWITDYEDAGNYQVIFTVKDNGEPELTDSKEVTIVVEETNRPPQFTPVGDQVAQEAQFFELIVSATDPDEENSLTYSAQNLPAGAQFTPETHALTWTPGFDDAGEHLVSFAVSDDGEPVLSDTMTVKIIVGGTNRPPQFELIGEQEAFEAEKLEFTVNATDPDGNELVYSVENIPEGAEFDSESRIFFWFPEFSDEGSHVVHFIVTDDGEGLLKDIMDVTIKVTVNHPPVFDNIGPLDAKEAEPVEFEVVVTDPDGDNVALNMEEWPGDAVFDIGTRIFSWTPGFDDVGDYTVLFSANDDGTPEKSSTLEVSIQVANNNRAPVLDPIGPKSVDPGNEETLTFTVTASDPDLDNLIYSVSGLPGDASFINQVFNWFPGSADVGIHTVRFIVTDDDIDNPLSTFEDVQIQVAYGFAPFVISTTPPDSPATAPPVSINTQIIAQFSKPVDLASVGGNPFTVFNLELQQTVSGTVTYQQDTFSAVFTPLAPLAPASQYSVTVDGGVTDLDGTPMGQSRTWSFITQ